MNQCQQSRVQLNWIECFICDIRSEEDEFGYSYQSIPSKLQHPNDFDSNENYFPYELIVFPSPPLKITYVRP